MTSVTSKKPPRKLSPKDVRLDLVGKPKVQRMPPKWHALVRELDRLGKAFGKEAGANGPAAYFAAMEATVGLLVTYARRIGTLEDEGFTTYLGWTPPENTAKHGGHISIDVRSHTPDPKWAAGQRALMNAAIRAVAQGKINLDDYTTKDA
jgi:hypothetical protein